MRIAEEATGVIMISTQDQSHSFHSDLEYNSTFTLRISHASPGLGPWSRSRTVVGLSLSRKES